MTIKALSDAQCKQLHNQLKWEWAPNQNLVVSGSDGHIHSYHQTVSYTVTVLYTGPVNIGDRTIFKQNIPNYWKESNVVREATIASGDSCCLPNYDPGSWCTIIALFALVGTIPCGLVFCIQKMELEKYDACLNQIAIPKMANHIARLVNEADSLVDQRIAAIAETTRACPSVSSSPSYTWQEVQGFALRENGAYLNPIPGVDPTTARFNNQEVQILLASMQKALIDTPSQRRTDPDLRTPLLPPQTMV